MADSQDASLLKRRARRRLVGAIALVVFIVIVLPIVLDQEPRPVTQDLTVQIPSRDAGRFNTRVLPPLPPPPAESDKPVLPKDSGSNAAPGAASGTTNGPSPPAQAAKPSENGSKAVAPASKAATNDDAKAGAKDAPAGNTAETLRAQALLNDQAWVVPLGAFVKTDNARRAQSKAATAGIKSYMEMVPAKQGEQARVRAGPFETREAAEEARDKLKGLGLAVGAVVKR